MPTPHMGLTLPVDHNTNDLWGNVLNQAMGLVDAHRHLPGEGRQVPSDGINIDKALPFNGFRATTLGGLSFSSAANPAVNKSLWVADGTGGTTANELYWRNNTGFQVQLTSGTTLNLAFVGGIVDDYASVGALLGYDDGLKRYTFKQGTGDSNLAAHLHTGSIRISPFGAALNGNYVEHAVDGAIASNYILTWPAAAPAATQSVSISAAGIIETGASQALAANNSYTVSGTGQYKHGTRTLQVPLLYAGSNVWNNQTLASGTVVGLSLVNGVRITELRARIKDSAVTPTKLTISLQSVADGVASTVATSAQSAGSGANQTLSVSGLTSTVVSGTNFQILFTKATGADTCSALWIEVDYDRL
jgi:hypothetical protein